MMVMITNKGARGGLRMITLGGHTLVDVAKVTYLTLHSILILNKNTMEDHPKAQITHSFTLVEEEVGHEKKNRKILVRV